MEWPSHFQNVAFKPQREYESYINELNLFDQRSCFENISALEKSKSRIARNSTDIRSKDDKKEHRSFFGEFNNKKRNKIHSLYGTEEKKVNECDDHKHRE